MATANNPKDSRHNNNNHKNLKAKITSLYGNEVLMIFVCWKNDINNDHYG